MPIAGKKPVPLKPELKYCVRMIIKSGRSAAASLALALTLSGCPSNFDPSPYDSRGYDNSGYGYDSRRDDYYRERDYRRERELERERRELEREREELEEERRRRNDKGWERQYQEPPPPRHEPERCPSGFSPSERKCSSDERRNGCRDMRLPGGLGCVSR